MKRDIHKAAEKKYDLIIIGGGITGACVAWDAALRGLSCLLLEKQDFGHATSSATSKLIHGGLRYLKNFELSLVRESLSERKIFEEIAPHLVHPVRFMIPIYGHGMDSRLPLMAALTVYDVLGYDKKDLDDKDKQIPNHRFISKKRALTLVPGLKQESLTSAAVYYDCQMHSPDRLTLEFILSAHEYGAEVLNYMKVTDFIVTNNQVRGVIAQDSISDQEYRFFGAITANVSGPWADMTLSLLKKDETKKQLVRSKGIHLITKSLTKRIALVLKTETDRHFFIIPWRGYSLLGTTDTKYIGDPDSFKVTEKDISDFIAEANKAFPGAKLDRNDVLYFYGGLRPLVDTDTDIEVYDASRRYEITDHSQSDDIEGLITVIGGKYTTSRNLAEKIIDLVYKKLKREAPDCHTDTTPLIGGHTGQFNRFLENAQQRNRDKYNPSLIEHLVLNYGSEYQKMLKLIKSSPKLGERISERTEDIVAQLEQAIEHEMALTLDDLLFRRTGIATIGHPGDEAIKKCARFAAKRLRWSKKRINQEIEQVLDRFIPGHE